jgi:hypothetical protein
MGPGTRSSFAGRADVQPVIKVFSFLVLKEQVALQVEFGGVIRAVAAPSGTTNPGIQQFKEAT